MLRLRIVGQFDYYEDSHPSIPVSSIDDWRILAVRDLAIYAWMESSTVSIS